MKKNDLEHPFYLQIQKEINRIEKKSDKYRNYYYILRVLLITLAGSITIASGWQSELIGNKTLNLILVLGALSTAITAFDTLFQLETKKNTFKLMLVELREIRSEVVFYNEQNTDELEIRIRDFLFPKYQATIAHSKGIIGSDEDNADEP